MGDLPGVVSRLDYLQWLGVDAIWLSPLHPSPFTDAGYDVTDYFDVAPRYGSLDDVVTLIKSARQRDIRILLDLVPGHTSDRHPMFVAEANADGDTNTNPTPGHGANRYVWAPPAHLSGPSAPAMVRNPGRRGGFFLKNAFPTQPALNYGFARPHPDEPWRDGVDDPGPRRNRELLSEVIRFWIGVGVDGFRIDMAFSLVRTTPTSFRPKSCGVRSSSRSAGITHTSSSSPSGSSRPQVRRPSTPTGSCRSSTRDMPCGTTAPRA